MAGARRTAAAVRLTGAAIGENYQSIMGLVLFRSGGLDKLALKLAGDYTHSGWDFDQDSSGTGRFSTIRLRSMLVRPTWRPPAPHRETWLRP